MQEDYCSIKEFKARLTERSHAYEGDAQTNSITLSAREINLLAESISKELNLWIDFSDVISFGTPAPSGVENDVYFDNTTNSMIKVNNLMLSKDVLSFLKRIEFHNFFFPQTEYHLVGFTGFGNGSIYPVLKQDYIPNATFATHGEILDYMEALGAVYVEDATFRLDNVLISDLRPRNVLKSIDSHN